MDIAKGNKNNIFARIFQVQWMSILLGVVLLTVVLSILQPSFSSFINLRNILVQASAVGIMAVGMTFVIMTGGIDISVGMNLFLMMTIMSELQKFLPPIFVLLSAIIGSVLVGAFNGFLVCNLKITPFIATFATLSICRGLGYWIIKSQMRSVVEGVRVIGSTRLFDIIPVPVIIWILLCIVGFFILSTTRFGRYVLAVGNSVNSAQASGIPVNKVKFGAYICSALCAGLASLVYIGRLGTVQADLGYGLEFQVITAVVLGGTKLIGGKGTIIGGFIGAIFLILTENGISLMELNIFTYDIARGLLLFIAVVLDIVSYTRQQKTLIRERAMRLRLSL
ncbi:MAG TPA: ABC transporter permease [Desulfitobacteriaceae bacterium]|nr:ABC transporter permease [Desulfitobacteriaceae bacterium]